MTIIHHLALLLLFALFLTTTAYGESSTTTYGDFSSENLCIYTLYIKTGRRPGAGTDSKISVSLDNEEGARVEVPNIEVWGLMGPKHNYFERKSLDIFSGMAPCITSPICRLNLTSDGSGSHHSWYCKYVKVTSTKLNKECSETIFHVDRWLSKIFSLSKPTAIIDTCKSSAGTARPDERFVDGNPGRSVA